MTKVKICGITNLEDAELSVKFGADALGFNFYAKSPRFVTPEAVAEIIAKLRGEVLKVGVFVNETLDNIVKTAAVAGLDAIQLHGEETPEFLNEVKAKTGLEIIKAFRVSPDFKPEDVLKYDADAILLDAYNPKEHGGTGETFDWEIAKKVQEIFPKMYLAGGLGPANIMRALGDAQPFAVDVCSGVELSKGIKDKSSVINFLSIVKWRNTPRNYDSPLDLIQFLRVARGVPGLYFHNKSVTQLVAYIVGFLHALGDEGSKSRYQYYDRIFGDFANYLNLDRGSYVHDNLTFATYFLKVSEGDDERSFDLFFASFEEFFADFGPYVE